MTSGDPESSTAYTKFIVLSGPRTGSTLLVDALNSSPDIVCFGEIFNQDLDAIDYRVDGSDPANVKDTALRAASPSEFLSMRIFGRHPQNVKAVGFKFHYDHFWGFPNLRQALEDDEDMLVIHLQRRNLLRVLVSGKIAEQTGAYLQRTGLRLRVLTMITTLLRRLFLARAKPARVKVTISPDDFRQQSMAKAMTAKHWEEIFASHQILPVSYEDMAADPQKEFARAQSFLGVTPATLEVRLARQNPQRLEELIENFTELRDAFLGTPAEWMFDD